MKLLQSLKGRILFNELLSKHTTFRIGGPCKIWAEPADEDDLRAVLRFARLNKKKIFIIGMGSNVLFNEKGFNGIVIRLAGAFSRKVRFAGSKAVAGAGVRLSHLVNMACDMGLSGMEGLVGIPGTVGGAIFMNSGYRGDISDCLEEVRVMDKASAAARTIRRHRNRDLNRFVILEGVFALRKTDRKTLSERRKELLSLKRKKQPLGQSSAGCVFKNPDKGFSAAKYIELVGLKGKELGGARISNKHANFIVNSKRAESSAVLGLMRLASERVKAEFGVELEPEIIIA